MEITEVIAAIAVIVALVTFIIQLRGTKRAERTQIFLEISTRWTNTYRNRKRLLDGTYDDVVVRPPDVARSANPGEDTADVIANFQDLFMHRIWSDLRPLLNFFETVGLLVHQGYLREEEVFVLVSVDYFPDSLGGPHDETTGSLIGRLGPFIDLLRKTYRPDIYLFYDHFLLPRYAMRRPLKPRRPFLLRWRKAEWLALTPA